MNTNLNMAITLQKLKKNALKSFATFYLTVIAKRKKIYEQKETKKVCKRFVSI